MSSPFDEGDDEGQERFPLSDEEREHVSQIIGLVRGNLSRPERPPPAIGIRALICTRTPSSGYRRRTVFGFRRPSIDRNWGWADIQIDSDEFRLGVGEHFYDPGVGGDTESRNIFEVFAGGSVQRRRYRRMARNSLAHLFRWHPRHRRLLRP
jgi:hypothetical protein